MSVGSRFGNLIILSFIIVSNMIIQPVHSLPSYIKEGRYDLKSICGKTSLKRNGKIVGGEEALQSEFPWLVHIKMAGRPHCGGALINNQFILTAGHCLASRPSSLFSVKLGASSTSDTEKGIIEMPIIKYHIHEFFNRPRSFSNDIAIIKIKPINFTDQILPICLPTDTIRNYENIIGQVAGFGWLEFSNGKLPSRLQKVDLPIIKNEMCESWFRENHHNLLISDSQFCAGYAIGRRDACKGDSGSPYNFFNRLFNQTEIIGIVSAGIKCAEPKMPGVYTKVNSYMNWIRHQMARL